MSEQQLLIDICLFVFVRPGRIMHGAAVFDRERRYDPTLLTLILLDFYVRVTLP